MQRSFQVRNPVRFHERSCHLGCYPAMQVIASRSTLEVFVLGRGETQGSFIAQPLLIVSI